MPTETLHFENARVAQQLYNNDAKNLQHLEDQLAVKVSGREGSITLEGEADAIERAKHLFLQLEGSLKAGTPIRTREFNHALQVVKHEGVTMLRDLMNDRVQTNFPKLGTLTFEEPDVDRFPAIELARKAGEIGGTLPAVLNAANEVAVEVFVNRKINFPQITETVRRTMDAHQVVSQPTLEQILEADSWARREAAKS